MAQKRQRLSNGLEAGPTPSKVAIPTNQSPESSAAAGRLLFQDNKIKLLEAELEAAKKRANEYQKDLAALKLNHKEDLKKYESLLQFHEAEQVRDAIPGVNAMEVDQPGPSEKPPEILPLGDPKFKSQTLLLNILIRSSSKVSPRARDHQYHKFLIQEDNNLPDGLQAEEMHTRFQEILHISNREPLRRNDFGPYSIPHRPQLKSMQRIETDDISVRVPIWMAINAEQGALLFYPNNERNGSPRVMKEAMTAGKVGPLPVFQKGTKEMDTSYKLLNFFSKSHV